LTSAIGSSTSSACIAIAAMAARGFMSLSWLEPSVMPGLRESPQLATSSAAELGVVINGPRPS
jgi:hypothetical protein